MQSKSITIPTDVKTLVHGKDRVMDDFMESELKLIVYAYSTGCSSCNISKMHLWNDLIAHAKPFGDRLKYYFIFAPRIAEEPAVREALEKTPFGYPVILDTKKEFERINPHLPKNKALHAFLLDADNNVILVGNPLNNAAIEKMFLETTTEMLGKSNQK